MPELRRFAPTPRARNAMVAVAQLAEKQGGVASRGQLVALAVSESTISRWVESGRLHRVYPSVYAVGHRSLAMAGRARAALLYAGRGSALSHQTGGWWLGLLSTEPARLHVTTPLRRRSLADLRVHDRITVPVIIHNGLPVTSVAQTLLNIAATMRFHELRLAVAEADHQDLLVPAEIDAILGRGRSGSAALRAAVNSHLPELASARSVLEQRFLLLCEAHALPIPEVNVRIEGLVVDALWRNARVVVELDGHKSHARTAAAERDRHRDLTLRAAGFTVLRYTWQQVTREPELVVTDLRRALSLAA